MPAEVSVRGFGHWNFGLAAILLADASDVRALVALSHYIVVINLMADVGRLRLHVRRGGAQRSPVCALRRRDHWCFEVLSDLFRRVPIARRRRVLRDARAVGAPLPVVRSTSYP